ncbi:MAG: NAD(P)-binding domain-containing protein [Verrucomicrobiota bacterium]
MNPILDFVVSGAGVSGVIVSKYLKENDISFMTMEKRDGIGGLWYYSDDEDVTTVTRHTITTSGKRVTTFSDFAPHEDWGEFLGWQQMLTHIREYADHFDIMDNIALSTEIVSADKQDDGLWKIDYQTEGEPIQTVFAKNFVIAGGAFTQKMTPIADKFSETFDGEIYHAQQVKMNNKIKFRGKRVLITGGGETASDMASHAACVADQAFWAIPDGLHSIDRCIAVDNPEDPAVPKEMVFDEGPSLTRNHRHTQHLSEKEHNNLYYVEKSFGANGHGVKEWVVPNYYGNKFPIKNGEVIYLVHEGKIKPYSRVENIQGKTVTFENGMTEEIDMIIESTGYKKSYKYFADQSYAKIDYDKLYRNFINIEDQSIWYVGLVRPMIGSVPAFVEYQSQYLVDLFTGKIELPSKEVMIERIAEDAEYHRNVFDGCRRFRRDILDGYTHYPYVMSKDMGRLPEDHLEGLTEEEKEKVLHTSYNSGLFLWVGDEKKRRQFIESIHISPLTVRLRKALHKNSVTGSKMLPKLHKLDSFLKKKNAANLLINRSGALHRRHLVRKKFPLLQKLIDRESRGNCGPFPRNHPYFTYQGVDFATTPISDKIALAALLLALFGGANLVGNLGFNWSTLAAAPIFIAGLFALKPKKKKIVLGIGLMHTLACLVLGGFQLNLELLFVPGIYALIVSRVMNLRKSIPVLRDEVAAMQ